jgi:hypothetical protein
MRENWLMTQRNGKTEADSGTLHASTSFHEVFRHRKSGRTRVYNLKVLDDGRAELWVVSEQNGRMTGSRKLVTFDNADDAAPFLQEIERELRQGGWSEV